MSSSELTLGRTSHSSKNSVKIIINKDMFFPEILSDSRRLTMGYVFNWRSFYIQRQKVYNVVWRTFVTLGIGSIIYVGSLCVVTWNAGVQRMWLHYVKKERERAELMELIREAREVGSLPPSDVTDFQ